MRREAGLGETKNAIWNAGCHLFDLRFLSPHVRLEVVVVHHVDGHGYVALGSLPHLIITQRNTTH